MPRTSRRKVFIGIDPSLTGTGIVAIDSNATILEQLLTSTPAKQETEIRITCISTAVAQFCRKYKPTLICIEGISFGSKGSSAYQLGALHYYLRIRLYKTYRIRIVAPSELKKFVAGPGKGNCKKQLILLKTFKKWGEEFDDDNLCDAYCLARFALEVDRGDR